MKRRKERKVKRIFRNIGTLVKTRRKEYTTLSQTDLAGKLGYGKTGQFVSNIERGLCSVPLEKIGTLADALEVEPSQVKSAMVRDFAETLDNIEA